MAKPTGLYANIHRKRARIARQKAAGGKVERMRKPGSIGAPPNANVKRAVKTAKKGRWLCQKVKVLTEVR